MCIAAGPAQPDADGPQRRRGARARSNDAAGRFPPQATRRPRRRCAAGARDPGGPALAQDYPARAVKIIVPFAAGGPADLYARDLGRRLQEVLGQPFVVDDRPGAGSVVGTDAAAKSAPDGYTLLLISNAQTVNESLLANKPYALMRDFVPIAPINYSDLVMVVHPSVPAKTLAEFIALAKAQPGKLNYASSGPGTPYHMAGELFKAMAGVDIVHVPYRGSSGARIDLIGGQVQMMFDAVTTMSEHVKAGQVRALATTGRTRSTVLPDVPTVAEAGVPGYEATIWLGIDGAQGNAAGHCKPIECRDHAHRQPLRHSRRMGRAGCDGNDHGARRIWQVHRGRHREVGARGQDFRRQT